LLCACFQQLLRLCILLRARFQQLLRLQLLLCSRFQQQQRLLAGKQLLKRLVLNITSLDSLKRMVGGECDEAIMPLRYGRFVFFYGPFARMPCLLPTGNVSS
jgi:hypothetical protein